MCWAMSPWETSVSCPPYPVAFPLSQAAPQKPHASSQITLPISHSPAQTSSFYTFGIWILGESPWFGPHLLPCFSADCLPSDPVQPQYGAWLSLVDRAQVKAFVDLTLSPSVRQGAQHLLQISGLGELLSLGPLGPMQSLLPSPRE